MSLTTEVPKNDSKVVQVTVVILYNGTYLVSQHEDPSLQIAEIVLLVIVFLISFGINIFLLVTITSSYTLRRVPFNILLVHLSIVFLAESLVNMSIALHYVAVDTWKLGIIGCSISSFTVQLVTLEITFSLSIMCAEGMVSVWQPFRFQTYLTIKKQIVAIVTIWVASILLCLPLILESITSRLFPSRYGCSSAGHDGYVHALFITIWCYCLMTVLGLGCLVNIGVKQFKEYKSQRKKHGVNYSDVFMQGDLWTEWVNLKLVAWLCLFYLLLELPYIVIHQISALETYSDSTDMRNSTTTILIQITPKYETVFTWFRYAYSCLFAALVFKMRKDIRHKFRALLNCCRTNIVRDHSPLPVVRQENRKIKDKGEKKDSNLPLSLNTPVLYISPEGLCLRQLDPNSKMHNKYSKDGRYVEKPSFISYLCDVETVSISEDFRISPVDSFRSENNKTRLSEESQRRFSEESEISLPEMGSSYLTDMQSQEIPKKDIDSTVLEYAAKSEPSQPKKTVRFADTLTIYRTLTPKYSTPTPEWVVNKKIVAPRNITRKSSRIPTRISRVEHTTPWKVELNKTYGVNSPIVDSRVVTRIVDGSKLHNIAISKSKSGGTNNIQNRDRHRPSFTKPTQWKINK